MQFTYAVRPADTLVDNHGNPRAGVTITVHTAHDDGAEPVDDVTPLDGSALDGNTVTSNDRGRFGFQSDTGPVVWLDDGDRDRWPVMAIEAAVEATERIGEVQTEYHRALAAAGQAARDAQTAERARDAPDTAQKAVQNIETTREQTVILDELYATIYLPCWNYNTTLYKQLDGVNAELSIFTAPFPLVLHRVIMSYEYTEVEPSNSNYWTFLANQWRGGDEPDEIARSTTQSTGPDAGGGVQPRVPRHIDVDDDTIFAAGDVMTLRMQVSGDPDPLWFAAAVTVQYTPA